MKIYNFIGTYNIKNLVKQTLNNYIYFKSVGYISDKKYTNIYLLSTLTI